MYGSIAQPLPAPTDFTAVTGGAAGIITVARVAPIPSPATQMLWRAIDTTTQLVPIPGASTLTGLVTGRPYKVQASWWGPNGQLSEWSAPITVAPG